MRVLLTWELGLHLGHLTRLLPVAQQLKAEGHVVLVAVRDIQAAATVLGPASIPFVQAPHLPQGIPLAHRATGYADILLSQGWSDRSALWGLTQGWLTIFQLFKPDKLILDYSPTVSLAARIAKIPTILVGNGFELPPLTDPLPPFPGFSWAIPEKAAISEKMAVADANGVPGAFKAPQITALRDLVMDQIRLLATFSELDHYGERKDGEYIGPLLGQIHAPQIDWPEGEGPKIFACLRPDTSRVKEILIALTSMTARVVCVAGGFTKSQLEPLRKEHIKYSLGSVDLQPLLDADLCITYGAEGTMMRFLLAGVPQLISPWHIETFMAARHIEAEGFGISLTGISDNQLLAEKVKRIAGDKRMRQRATTFSEKQLNADKQNGPVSTVVERLQNGRCKKSPQTQTPYEKNIFEQRESAKARGRSRILVRAEHEEPRECLNYA
jgi:UDP:flavonoid glycosyltransferase YjiC (YdhE family)